MMYVSGVRTARTRTRRPRLIVKNCYGESDVMQDILILLGIVASWFVLQAYILPKMGVPT